MLVPPGNFGFGAISRMFFQKKLFHLLTMGAGVSRYQFIAVSHSDLYRLLWSLCAINSSNDIIVNFLIDMSQMSQ